MDTFGSNLNELLISAFRSVLKIEEQMLKSMSKLNLSISEMHMIEAIGTGENQRRNVGEIAKELSLTMPSVTVALNKLEAKGFVKKTKDTEDGRSVVISLTEDGAKINRVHQHFHDHMGRSIAADLTEEEKDALIKGMVKMNDFFNRRLT